MPSPNPFHPLFFGLMKHFRLYLTPLLLLLLLAARLPSQAQGVGIGTSTPAPAAALEIKASDKGLLIPRLTAAQRAGIATPPQGLMVYQTDGKAGGGPGTGFWYFGGNPAAWVFLNPTGGGADNLGNHTATTSLNLGANALTGTGASVGTAVGLGVRADGGLNIGQNTSGNNVLLGYQAGAANTTGTQNQFVGYGSGSRNTTGSRNLFTGHGSGSNNTTGSENQFIGYLSGQANTTGSFNQFIGSQSGFSNTTGSANQFEGIQSGSSNRTGSRNSFFGPISGANNTTGNYNTAVGNSAGPTSGNLRNTTALGSEATVSTNNTIQLGDANIMALRCQVGLTVVSDARFKYDVRANVPGLAFVAGLRPVTYRLDAARQQAFERTGRLPARSAPAPQATVHTGFLAQDVAATARALGFVFDGVHAPASARDSYGLAYAQFVVPLVRAVQELNQQVRALQTQNAALQATTAQATTDHAALLVVQAQLTRLLGEAPVARAAGR